MPKSNIYTGTGDKGSTGLADGTRVGKPSQRIKALGAVDELNAALGLALASGQLADDIADRLTGIQNNLFVIGAILARANGMQLPGNAVESLESSIDTYDALLPAMTHFILPGGTPAAAQAHLARTVCRRAERSLWGLYHEADAGAQERLEPLSAWINRLGDYLFVLARHLNEDGTRDVLWEPA